MSNYLCVVDECELPVEYDCYWFAGAYCINAIEWCSVNNLKYKILPQFDLEFKDIHDRYLYLEKVKDKVLTYLTDRLNEYHKSDYSEYKWRILLNDWLVHFIPSMFDKYSTIRSISRDERIYHIDLYNTGCIGCALDHLDFLNILEDDFGFHKYEYSILLKYMPDITNIKVSNTGEYKRIPFHEYTYGALPEHVEGFLDDYRNYKEKTGEQDEMVIQSPYIKFSLYKEIMEQKYGKISGYFTDYVRHIRNNIKMEMNIDVAWRNKERDIAHERDEFVSILYKAIFNFIPVVYIELFSRIKEMSLANYRWGRQPKVLLFDAEGVKTNELFKIYMMNIDIENIKKADIMHAPVYDLGGYSWDVLSEFQLCDDFLICGGVHNDSLKTNFIQMPFISLFRMDKVIGDGDKIIYANYSYPQHKIRLSLAEWNWGKYIEKELKFLKMLDKSVISELKFRPHPLHKNQWNDINKIKKEIPEIAFDDVPDFYESMRNAKLVISEVLGSAAMEAIGIGKPTIILFNPKIFFVKLNNNYKDVEDMIRVGIIAETPERLADIVNHIHDDVESWWNEPGRQKVVCRIREKYMYFPENAKELWVEKIKSYVD